MKTKTSMTYTDRLIRNAKLIKELKQQALQDGYTPTTMLSIEAIEESQLDIQRLVEVDSK